MKKETLEALKSSIEKWKNIILKKESDLATLNCPLCRRFYEIECVAKGEKCPVFKAAGRATCRNTPYADWCKHHIYKHRIPKNLIGYEVECPTCTKLAKRELRFLKSLLPRKEGAK